MSARIRFRLSRLFSGRRGRKRPFPGTLQGCQRNVIVVQPPDRRFTQVLFFLRDDYLSSEENRDLLLRQAREAAQRYTRQLLPPGRFPIPWLLLGLVLAVGLLAAVLLNLL